MMLRKERLPEKYLLAKTLWDVLPASPPYPPIPRGIARGIFGREFEEKSWIKFKPPWEE